MCTAGYRRTNRSFGAGSVQGRGSTAGLPCTPICAALLAVRSQVGHPFPPHFRNVQFASTSAADSVFRVLSPSRGRLRGHRFPAYRHINAQYFRGWRASRHRSARSRAAVHADYQRVRPCSVGMAVCTAPGRQDLGSFCNRVDPRGVAGTLPVRLTLAPSSVVSIKRGLDRKAVNQRLDRTDVVIDDFLRNQSFRATIWLIRKSLRRPTSVVRHTIHESTRK